MKKRVFCGKKLAIKLHELDFYKPSKFYYEWTGATEIEELTSPGWLIDSINVYTARQLKNALPKNVAVNKNVMEIGYKASDNEVDQLAKLLIYLLKNKMITL